MAKLSGLPLNRFLAVAVVCWALNFIALKRLFEEASPPVVALLRFFAMAVCLIALAPAFGESLRIPKADRSKLFLFGFLSMGVYMVLFLEGMRNTGPAEGAILLNLSPILTILLAAAAGQERLRLGTLFGAVIAFLGIVMVMGSGIGFGPQKILGNALVLVSALAWASSMVLGKPLFAAHGTYRVLTLSMAPGLPVLIVYWLIADMGRVPNLQWSTFGWLSFAHVSLLSGVVAFLCYYRGVRDSGPAGASLAMYFVPPLAALIEWAIYGHALTYLQGVGLTVVLLGTTIANAARSGALGLKSTPVGKI